MNLKCPSYRECQQKHGEGADTYRLLQMALFQLEIIAGYENSSEEISDQKRAQQFLKVNRVERTPPTLPMNLE